LGVANSLRPRQQPQTVTSAQPPQPRHREPLLLHQEPPRPPNTVPLKVARPHYASPRASVAVRGGDGRKHGLVRGGRSGPRVITAAHEKPALKATLVFRACRLRLLVLARQPAKLHTSHVSEESMLGLSTCAARHGISVRGSCNRLAARSSSGAQVLSDAQNGH